MRYALALLATLLAGCQNVPPGMASQIGASNTQLAQTATMAATAPTATAVQTDAHNTARPAETATATPSPTNSIVTVTPRPTTTPVEGIVEVNGQELDWLAATCWIEGRGFGDKRIDLCASVVSTIMLRTRERIDSDGTIFGTLTHNCTVDSASCAFPAWAVYGCEGIKPQVCPFYDDQGMIDFRAMVNTYLEGDYTAPCENFPYYDSRVDRPAGACLVTDAHGNTEVFHR